MNGSGRQMKPPGGECHDIFEQGTNFNGSSAPSNPHHRITKPPGGETSDIFSTPTSTPPSTPRRVKNYMASNIFGPAANGVNEPKNIRSRPDGNSFNRLFGNGVAEDVADGTSPPATPRVAKNYQKSNVIFAEQNGAVTNGRHVNGNGYGRSIDGSEGSISGSSSGSVTPNGSINGDVDHPRHETPNVTPSRRVPPGGFSTKLW